MLPRFLAESIDPDGLHARLAEDEARHLSQVLRLGAGDEIAVFDGMGREFRGRIVRVGRDGAEVLLTEEVLASPEPSVRVTLAQAAIKGEKMDDVVRDATMMGVAAIEPLVSEHTVAHLRPGHAPDRWRRIAIASAKQCRRAVVPAIGPGSTFADWLPQDRAGMRLLLVEPSAAVEGHPVSTVGSTRPASASLMVGPEGGWTPSEIDAAADTCCLVTLRGPTLRADAMTVAALAALFAKWGEL